ncbi:MAG: His-Xaa-Ser system radical SAM maturase HxsB [Candidatus Diapherotrites archaeon]|nr:His-Xaa-Ser system radical SAM maturase HxsB [Candidatus Diapherotrites archaeon]
MVKSYFDSAFLQEGYVLNDFSTHKFNENEFLLTTGHGSWATLSKEEYAMLRFHKLGEDPNLFDKLKEKGIILTESNVENVVRDYKERHHFLFYGPTLHIITPTMRCNMHCAYCHSSPEADSAEGNDMDLDTAKAVVDFIFKSPAKNLVIEFQGGECLLNFSAMQFVFDYAEKKAKESGKKLKFSLVTNLTKMDETILKELASRKIMGLSTSLDGPKELHDKNRKYLGGNGSYDDAVYWIKRIKSKWEKNFNLSALGTITRHSLPMGKEIVDEYISLGFDSVWLRPLNNIGFAAKSWKKIGYPSSAYNKFYRETLDYIVKKNSAGTPIKEAMATIFAKKIIQKRDPMMVDIMSPCGAAIGQLLYKFNGDIHSCDEGKIFEEFRLGNVKTSSYADIFNNKTTISLIDVSSKKGFLCNKCAWSPYCGVCPVYIFSAQGTIVSQEANDERCKMMGETIRLVFDKMLHSEEYRKALFNWVERDTVFV